MRFLLDTNAVIALLEGHRSFVARLRTYRPSDFGMSAIVHHELCFGAYKSKRVAANLQNVHALQFEVLPISKSDAERSGEIHAALQGQGDSHRPLRRAGRRTGGGPLPDIDHEQRSGIQKGRRFDIRGLADMNAGMRHQKAIGCHGSQPTAAVDSGNRHLCIRSAMSARKRTSKAGGRR